MVTNINETQKPFQSLTIIGRRWFQKSYGNTYYSSIALIDGKEVARIPFSDGYGNQYEQDMVKKLHGMGLLPGRIMGTHRAHLGESGVTYSERLGIAYETNVTDVTRERDL